jgi:lysophospholipase L1-like esterase
MTLRNAKVLPISKYNPAEFDSAGATLHFVAEGDSWFSLSELPAFSIPPTDSMLHQLPFESDVWVLQLAKPGDEIRKMVDWRRNTEFETILKQGFGPRVDGIFLSGGGNDLFAALDQGVILQASPAGADATDPAAYVNAADFAKLAEHIRASYAEVIRMRDARGNACKGAPVFVHTYDVPMPRDAPATVLFARGIGPWMLTALQRLGPAVPEAMYLPISRHVVGLLRDVLMDLDSMQGDAAHRLPNFHVIDTVGTLLPWTPDIEPQESDWVNEIHPSRKGYKQVGQRFAQGVRGVLNV